MSDEAAEDDLRLELLRADHRHLTDQLADISHQIRRLTDRKREIEHQLADNEKQWK